MKIINQEVTGEPLLDGFLKKYDLELYNEPIDTSNLRGWKILYHDEQSVNLMNNALILKTKENSDIWLSSFKIIAYCDLVLVDNNCNDVYLTEDEDLTDGLGPGLINYLRLKYGILGLKSDPLGYPQIPVYPTENITYSVKI